MFNKFPLGAEFIESVELKYGSRARQSGCLLASACGFDSVPADIGVLATQAKFSGPGEVPSSIESFLTLNSTMNSIREPFLSSD